jgi:hypothetical protein
LCEMGRKVVFDGKLAHDTLGDVSMPLHKWRV